MIAVSHFSDISHSVASEMAGSSHTPACCLSKLRSSLEAGKKQFRVWLEYVCSVAKMLFYPPFRVLLLSPYDSSKKIRSGFEEGSKFMLKYTLFTEKSILVVKSVIITH